MGSNHLCWALNGREGGRELGGDVGVGKTERAMHDFMGTCRRELVVSICERLPASRLLLCVGFALLCLRSFVLPRARKGVTVN